MQLLKLKIGNEREKDMGNESTNSSPITSTPQNFKNNQSFGKATARAARNLPQSPRKKAAVISHLVSNLSPSSKTNVFESARKKLTSYMGRPTIPEETRKALVSFLERPDLPYCKPGRGDTVYCGKNQAGEKIYKSKHYLLWTLKELVEIFNIDNSIQASYYFMQKTVESEKHIFKIGDTAEDDCRCDKCENVELLLISVKKYFKGQSS